MPSSRLPDLVRDSRLDTEFRNGLTIHSYTASGAHRRIEKERVHWEKVKEIGKGGFGSVHLETRRGSHASEQPEVRAVKHIRQVNHQNWVHELEAVAKFSNKQYEYCFVKSFGWYESDDSLYIAMEYLPSGDLYTFISNGTTLSESESQDITYQILEGIFLMHDNGFAHRDLKPQNILVKGSPPNPWWVKIADFGISKRIDGESASASTVKGTLEFMAPELFNSRRKGESSAPLDIFATDIWAVGCMAFLMLTGSMPFPSLRELMFYSGNKEELSTSLLEEHRASSVAQEFIGSLLAPTPAQRPKAEDALDHTWIAHLSMDADGELSVEADPEPVTQAQSQPEDHTTTFWAEEMQTWTTKPVGVTLSQGVNNSIHGRTDEIPHTSAAYRKPIPGVKEIETVNLNEARDSQRQQIRKESTDAGILERISTIRQRLSRPFPPSTGPVLASPTTDGYVSPESLSRIRSSLDGIYQDQPPQPAAALTDPSDVPMLPSRRLSMHRSRLDRDIPSSSTPNLAETTMEKPILLGPPSDFRDSIQTRRARRAATRHRDSTPEKRADDSLAPNNDGIIGEVAPVSLTGVLRASKTSSKPLSIIKADIIRVLERLRISYDQIEGGFRCALRYHPFTGPYWDPDTCATIIFEIFVIKAPIMRLHGLQFDHVDGDTRTYRARVAEILDELRL